MDAPGRVALADNLLFRVGTNVPVDGRVSWIPETASGLWPANCYVLREGDEALIVDPGFAAVEAEVLAGLRCVLADAATPRLFVSRSQYDCLGNAGAIAAEFDLKDVYTGGSRTNPFDSFEAVVGFIAQRKPDLKVARVQRSPAIEIGRDRVLVAHAVKLRILATFWAYDASTKTLFTSDSFTHGMVSEPDGVPVIDSPERDETTPAGVRAHLLASFHWLAHADDLRPVIREVESIFAQHEVAMIAPNRGCVLKGPSVVERHYGMLMDALRFFDGGRG